MNVTLDRCRNRALDALAVLFGYCNARAEKGGYRHWRCGHKRGHGGEHRYRNYTWPDAGGANYSPTASMPTPLRGRDRSMVMTRRQHREALRRGKGRA